MEASAPETTSRKEELLFSLKLLGLFVISLMVICHVLVAPNASEARLVSDIGRTLFIFATTQALYVLALGVATLYAVTVIIYSATAAHSEEHDPAAGELPRRLVATWKRFIITWVYVTLLASSCVLSAVFFVGYSATVFKDAVLRTVVLLLVTVSYSYLVAAWILESILQTLEGECSGEASDDPELQEGLLLEEGRCCSEEDDQVEMSIDGALVGRRRKGSDQGLKFWLVLAVAVLASLGLVFFGINEGGWKKGQILTTIVSTFLFLSTELLIFLVVLMLYWCLRKAEDENRSRSGGCWFMFWFPLPVILALLLLDREQVFIYLPPCKTSMHS